MDGKPPPRTKPDFGFAKDRLSGLSKVDAPDPQPCNTVETGSGPDKVASLVVTKWRELKKEDNIRADQHSTSQKQQQATASNNKQHVG